MPRAEFITGANVGNAVRFRVAGQKRLWRCHECGEQTFTQNGRLLDPSEDGTSLVEHRHQFNGQREVIHAKTASTGKIALGGKRRVGKATVDERGIAHKLCSAHGCENRMSTFHAHVHASDDSRRTLFCRRHWFMLPEKTRRGLIYVQPWNRQAVQNSCIRFLKLKDAELPRNNPR